MPAEVLRFEVGVAQHARQASGQYPAPGPLGYVNGVRGYDALVPAVEAVDGRERAGGPGVVHGHTRGIGVVPAHPGRIGSGGVTVTRANSAISRANASA